MAQIYKIYMNESALIIADFSHIFEESIQFTDSQDVDFKNLYQQTIESENKLSINIRTAQPEILFKKIIKQVGFIKAAGGIVKNTEGNYLFIKRLGKWDLPKGKVEKGEKMKDAAVREVEEECGIRIDHLDPKVDSTYHSYLMKGKLVIKKTNWYAMRVNGVPKLVPQKSEDITKARWLAPEELSVVRKNTYPLIKELIKTM